MTSNAEEQANASGAAMVHPPKATKRANAMPPKRRVARGKPRSGKKANSAERPPKTEKAAKQAKPAASAREGSKSVRVLSLLRRPGGASRKELMKATGWLAHSVCGFLSGIVAKRMSLKLVSAKSEVVQRRNTVPRSTRTIHANKEPPRMARRFFFVRFQVGPEAISHERLRSYLLIELLDL